MKPTGKTYFWLSRKSQNAPSFASRRNYVWYSEQVRGTAFHHNKPHTRGTSHTPENRGLLRSTVRSNSNPMIYENHRRGCVVMLPITLESGTFSLIRHTLQLFFRPFKFFTMSFKSILFDLYYKYKYKIYNSQIILFTKDRNKKLISIFN